MHKYLQNFKESRNLNESNQNNKKNFNTYKTCLTITGTEIKKFPSFSTANIVIQNI